MAISVTALNSYTISDDSSSTYVSLPAVTASGLTSGYYYRLFYYITGYSTPIYTVNKGYVSSTSFIASAVSDAFPNYQILGSFIPNATQTGSSSQTKTTWYVSLVGYSTLQDYDDNIPSQAANSATSELTISFGTSFRSSATVSTARPINLETTTSIQISVAESSSDLAGSRTRVDLFVNTTLINSYYYTTGGTKTLDLSSFISAMKSAITDPDGYGDLKLQIYSGWTFKNGTFYSYSYVQPYTNGIYKSVSPINARNLGDNYYFASPNNASYFYLFARNASPNPVELLSNGNYNVYIEVWLYNNTNLSASAFSVNTATIDGAAATLSGFPTSVTKTAATTSLLGTISRTNFTASSVVRNPVIPVVVQITIAAYGAKSSGTISMNLPVVPELSSENIITRSITNGVAPASTQTTVGTISANNYSFYKVRISESTNGTTFSNSKDSDYTASGGETTKTVIWGSDSGTTARLAYSLYYYRFQIIGKDGLTYGEVTPTAVRSNDYAPVVSTPALYPDISSGKTNTSITLNTSVSSSVSNKTYIYSYRLTAGPGAWVPTDVTTDPIKTIIGLSSNTSYDFKVLVTNIDSVSNESSVLTGITTYSVDPQFSSPGYTILSVTDVAIQIGANATVDVGLTAEYSFGIRIGGVWTWTAYQAGSSYTHTGLSDGTTYTLDLKVRDNLGKEITYSSLYGTISQKTLAAAPVISSVSHLNLTNTSVSLAVNTANNPSTTINLWKFKIYADGDPVPGSWTERTSSTYPLFALTPSQQYNYQVQVVDNQTPPLSSSITSGSFTTLANPPAVSKKARFVRTLSTSMPTFNDGSFILTTDTGQIYLDNGSTRLLVSNGFKTYIPTFAAGTGNYTITTNDFDSIDTSKTAISLYLWSKNASVGNSTLTIDGASDIFGAIYNNAGSAVALADNSIYLLVYQPLTGRFIVVNS